MKEEHKEVFLNKHCRLTKHGGFVLEGYVLEVMDSGVIFKTDKKTSFIGFSEIDTLLPMEDY